MRLIFSIKAFVGFLTVEIINIIERRLQCFRVRQAVSFKWTVYVSKRGYINRSSRSWSNFHPSADLSSPRVSHFPFEIMVSTHEVILLLMWIARKTKTNLKSNSNRKTSSTKLRTYLKILKMKCIFGRKYSSVMPMNTFDVNYFSYLFSREFSCQ